MATQQKTNKIDRIEARLSSEAKEQIECAAQLQGRTVSDFVVAAALRDAANVIKDNSILQLSIKDSIALASVILNPPPPNANAIKAARRHKQKLSA